MHLTGIHAAIGVSSTRNPRQLFVVNAAISLVGITAVVGENGVGKTTFLRSVAGFAPTLSGSLRLNQTDPRTFRETEGIGFLPEQSVLPEALSGFEVLSRVWLAVYGRARIDMKTLDTVLGLSGVDFSLTASVATLSHGMRQRLSLAAALLPQPKLLLLDEPETGLDPAQRAKLRGALTLLAASGTAIMVSSHDISGLCLCAQQMCLISNGELRTLSIPDDTSAAGIYAMLPERWRP